MINKTEAYNAGMVDRQSGLVWLMHNPWDGEENRADWEAGWKWMDERMKAAHDATMPLDFGDEPEDLIK